MRKSMKVLLTSMVVIMLVISSTCSVFASSRWSEREEGSRHQTQISDTDSSESIFGDVDKNFWGYKAIVELAKRGIINGYSNKTFKPNARVTRSEFATMLTKALKLTAQDNTQTFVDVNPSSWDYNAVEASKIYLTGYKTSSGILYFYGSNNAVREDMAVALVKALNLTIESDNGQLQQVFTDYNGISANLRDFVYTAYKDGLMIGSNGKFAPQGTLTRAEAATLLQRALQKTEKVVVDGSVSQKVVVDNQVQSTIKNTDATLSSLAFNGTSIAGFNANTLSYNIVLPAGTTAVPTVTAAVYDTGKATSTITQPIGLPGYAAVVVKAEDGTTQKIYTINFTVAEAVKDTDATLSNITFNGTSIAGFNANTLTYNVVLPAGTLVVPIVTATVNDIGKATSILTQATGLPGFAAVVVTAQDGITKKTYTINFTVATS